MRDITTRNRDLKKVLTTAFGPGKVRVRGSRGTSYGYATVYVDHTPLDSDAAREMRTLCFQLLRKAGVDVGSRYTDDTCQSTSPEVSIQFNSPRYFKTMRHSDGTMSVMRDVWGGVWEAP